MFIPFAKPAGSKQAEITTKESPCGTTSTYQGADIRSREKEKKVRVTFNKGPLRGP